ncbi:uncharacterized protein TM35_000023720, partial [Trypanosoma theileri]
VGVAHAASAPGHEERVKEAKAKVDETLRLKAECDKVTKAAEDAAYAAQGFAVATENALETIAADPEKVEKTKSEGRKFIENTTQAAERAKEVADQTTDSARKVDDISIYFVGQAEEQMRAEEAAKDAENAARAANTAIENAETHAKRVDEAIKKLDAAVAAAAEKEKEKQVEPQPQEQTNETSLGEQQGHTEGNKTEQTQKEKQRQHYRSTFTINIHGDNLDALLNGGANNSGMAL